MDAGDERRCDHGACLKDVRRRRRGDAVRCDGAPIGCRVEECELPILGRWGGGWRREAEAGEVWRRRRRDRRGAGAC